MKVLFFCQIPFLLLLSCHRQAKSLPLIKNCDEINIIYFNLKDTFVFITTDSFIVRSFQEVITDENETFDDTCQTTQQVIYKNRGQKLMTASISLINQKNKPHCDQISYWVGENSYKHRLTYRTWMSIDEIYWHKVNPKSNPWPDEDTLNSRFMDLNNSR